MTSKQTTFNTAINLAPPKPKGFIEMRRWWNQICINALSLGIPSGCGEHERHFSCSRDEYYICTGCDHRDEMSISPPTAFIGFKEYEEQNDKY